MNWSSEIERSLIITRNNHGPSFVPCGTPALTGFNVEKQFELSFTLWNLPRRKSTIQFRTDDFSPSRRNFS